MAGVWHAGWSRVGWGRVGMDRCKGCTVFGMWWGRMSRVVEWGSTQWGRAGWGGTEWGLVDEARQMACERTWGHSGVSGC